jgi:dipeptidyl aminopeptidase/acylaminoacyl peptidase
MIWPLPLRKGLQHIESGTAIIMNRLTFGAGALLAASSITAVAGARPMTPEDVAKLESVGAIAVSPTGNSVAFTTASLPDITDGEKNGTTGQQLKLADAPDDPRDFLPADMRIAGARFSPDGSMISFLWAKGKDKRAVWGIPTNGGSHRILAAVDGAHVRNYAWNSDGSAMYLLAAAPEDTARTSESKAGFNAIVYEEEAKLNAMYKADIGAELDEDLEDIAVPGFVSNFKVARDDSFAAIVTAPTPNVDDSLTSARINIVDLASGATTVVATPGKIGDFEIAPDGSKLSLIAGVDVNDPAATTLHLVDVASGAFTALNAGAPEAAVDAEWLASGRLTAVIHKGASSVMRLYDNNGAQIAEQSAGSLAISAVEASASGIFVRASSARHPNELFAFNGDAGTFERWTGHNDWLGDITLGTQRTFTYTARDGEQIEGVLIEPVGPVPSGGAPLILDVHGGPEAHESNGWLTNYSGPGQVAAGKGYAVFLPNYRGSTGYGTAFSKQHQGDYAGKEFNDLVDAKRALVAEGIADPDRTGITGGSYGGYATAWGSTALSEEFAAGVMFVGISNQISKFGTTDIPKEMFNVHSLKWPWQDWQGMLEVSPIYHVEKAETPLLIMHGANDTRVAPSQSYELYRNIKVRKPDLPLRLVLYPGEGHGNRRAAARYDYNLRMMRWFDTYLMSGDRGAAMPGPRPQLPEGTTGAKAAAEGE